MKLLQLTLATLIAFALLRCQPKDFEPSYVKPFGLGSGLSARQYGDTLLIGSISGYKAIDLASGRELVNVSLPNIPLSFGSPERMDNHNLALWHDALYWVDEHPSSLLIGRIHQYDLKAGHSQVIGQTTFGNQIHIPPTGNQIIVTGYGRIYCLDIGGNQVTWQTSLLQKSAYFSVNWNPVGLILAAEGTDSMYVLDATSGDVRQKLSAPTEPRYGKPPFLFSLADGDILYGGEKTLCRMDIAHNKTKWKRFFPGEIQNVLVESDGTGCVFEANGRLSSIDSDGVTIYENTDYMCKKNEYRLATWTPLHDTIAVPSFCHLKTGISILQFPSLEEIAFHPCDINGQFAPLIFKGLLVYVPDDKNEIHAFRIPQ